MTGIRPVSFRSKATIVTAELGHSQVDSICPIRGRQDVTHESFQTPHVIACLVAVSLAAIYWVPGAQQYVCVYLCVLRNLSLRTVFLDLVPMTFLHFSIF